MKHLRRASGPRTRPVRRFLVIALLGMPACVQAPGDEARATSDPASDAAEEPATPRPVEPWVVDFASYGPVPLGVSFDEASAAADGRIEPPGSAAGCQYTRLTDGPRDVTLMVVDGRIVRVDVLNPDVRTRRGAGIGDAEARIRELYPEGLEVRPHKYTDGRYLIVRSPTGDGHRLVFEIHEGRVERYRAGTLPEVEWVEGCG